MREEGACQPCDVVFNGDSIASGTALQNRLALGGTVRVCTGRYQHTFALGANVTLLGAGDGEDAASSTTLDAGGSGRTLFVNETVTAVLRGVRISGGDDTLGGGVRNDGGLTLTACTLTGNTANLGGAIYYACNATGALVLNDCRLLENDANRGGGIFNSGEVTLNGAPVTANTPNNCAGALIAGCIEGP